MKIVFVNRFFYPDYSATSQFLTDLACHLSACNQDVVVITSRQRVGDPKAKLPASEVINGVRVVRLRTTCFGRPNLIGRAVDYVTFYMLAGYTLLFILGCHHTVVAKTDPPLVSVIVSFVSRLRGAKQVNWIQDLFPEVAMALKVKGIPHWAFALLRRLRNYSLRTARTNVVLSTKMADTLQMEGIPKDHIRIVHNWADGETFSQIDPMENSLRKNWNLEEKFVIGYSGNIGRAHEFETLLDAAELLLNEPEIRFLFIGDGAQLDWIKSQKETRHLINVCFYPYQPRESLAKSLSVPDIHIVSLRPTLEGLIVPSKFYGCLAAGRPVIYIGEPQSELAQILMKEQCGVAISLGESKKLSEVLIEFANNRKNCKAMGEKAQTVFKKRFEKKLALSTWTEILLHC